MPRRRCYTNICTDRRRQSWHGSVGHGLNGSKVKWVITSGRAHGSVPSIH